MITQSTALLLGVGGFVSLVALERDVLALSLMLGVAAYFGLT